jgi:hypothetical protein
MDAERRLPVRIRVGVPPEGLGQRLTEMTAWLDDDCGADGWAMTPSGTRGCSTTPRRSSSGRHTRERVRGAMVRRPQGRDRGGRVQGRGRWTGGAGRGGDAADL